MVVNRDFFLNKFRHKYGNTVDSFWNFSFGGSCLWIGVQWSISPFKSSQEIQYLSLPRAHWAKTVGLCLGVLQLGTNVRKTYVLLSFWVPPILCWKTANSTVGNFANGLRVFSAVFLLTICKQGYIRVETKETFHF